MQFVGCMSFLCVVQGCLSSSVYASVLGFGLLSVRFCVLFTGCSFKRAPLLAYVSFVFACVLRWQPNVLDVLLNSIGISANVSVHVGRSF